ncbi:hypothetical protein KGF56_003134 [Candida oxycetoniae]|uniref:Protein DSF2 n=1 Tax=Candida oxycetoniae TaxID=497107 RepID=A0AAI9SVY8_9ASCO|nr:uncharacterized protein KGF56_003134 [Candida oxycetoniae]KAI3404098.2 hypothetical protein KGF56_003134 [Candida oxycetoniae]
MFEDRESIYSFDSVSTSERLLDRLDFDNESIVSSNYDNSSFQRDRLTATLNQRPMSNLNAITRLKNYTNPTRQNTPYNKSQLQTSLYRKNSLPLSKTVNENVVSSENKSLPKKHADADITKVAINTVYESAGASASAKANSHHHHHHHHPPSAAAAAAAETSKSNTTFYKDNSVTTLPEMNLYEKRPQQVRSQLHSTDSVLTLKTTSSYDSPNSSMHTIPGKHLPYTVDLTTTTTPTPAATNTLTPTSSPSLHERSLNSSPSSPSPYQHHFLSHTTLSRTASAPTVRKVSSKENEAIKLSSYGYMGASSYSKNQSTIEYITPQPGRHHSNSTYQEVSPQSRTAIALELRALSNHREASYQLQIAANEPYHYPKAMYLYAMALKHGQGVKQNYTSAVKWLSKCILIQISSLSLSTGSLSFQSHNYLVMSKLNKLGEADLIQLVLTDLRNSMNTDPYQNGTNPDMLYSQFKEMSKNQIQKVINANKNNSNVLALSYLELGLYLYNNWGSVTITKNDEKSAIICLSKAGSLGTIEAMEQLGEIWATKSKSRKKDLTKAAAWLRSMEVFGVKSIGNSWIYKEKYIRSSS